MRAAKDVKQSQESLTSNQTGEFVYQQNYNPGHLLHPSTNDGKNKLSILIINVCLFINLFIYLFLIN